VQAFYNGDPNFFFQTKLSYSTQLTVRMPIISYFPFKQYQLKAFIQKIYVYLIKTNIFRQFLHLDFKVPLYVKYLPETVKYSNYLQPFRR
jgi:hypothetical protein